MIKLFTDRFLVFCDAFHDRYLSFPLFPVLSSNELPSTDVLIVSLCRCRIQIQSRIPVILSSSFCTVNKLFSYTVTSVFLSNMQCGYPWLIINSEISFWFNKQKNCSHKRVFQPGYKYVREFFIFKRRRNPFVVNLIFSYTPKLRKMYFQKRNHLTIIFSEFPYSNFHISINP